MTQSGEMQQLVHHLMESQSDRNVAVSSILNGAAQALAESRIAHQAMAQDQRQRLDKYVDGLRHNVEEMAHTAALFVKELDQAHQSMTVEQRHQLAEYVNSLRLELESLRGELDQARQSMAMAQRQELRQFTDDLCGQVDQLARNAARLMKELEQAHHTMSVEQRRALSEQMNNLHQGVAQFRKEWGDEIRAMSAMQQQELNAYLGSLRRDVTRLRTGATTYLQELDHANRARSDEHRRQMTSDRVRLTSEVATLLGQARAERKQTQADQAEARQLWSGMTANVRQRRTHTAFSVPAPVPASIPPEGFETATLPAPAPETAASEPAHDDLTELKGIGPSMQRRLHKANIFTYAQLAESKPEELRQALGEVASLANVEEWIEQARERVQPA